MGIFKKSTRKKTEKVLMDRLVTMDPSEPGYSETVDALEATTATKSDHRGLWAAIGTILAAAIGGAAMLLNGRQTEDMRRDTLDHFYDRELDENTVWSTSASREAERRTYR